MRLKNVYVKHVRFLPSLEKPYILHITTHELHDISRKVRSCERIFFFKAPVLRMLLDR